jgi:Holliday junction DNA helicase RuvB
VRVSFGDVPQVVDVDWWRRHRHLFEFNKRTGGLVFEPGVAPTTLPAVSRDPVEPAPGLGALIGQERVRANLRIAIRSAALAEESLGHVLLLGAPGLGKTSVARAVAAELGGDFESVMAPLIRDPALLVRQLTSLRPGSVLFLDEVHRLPPRIAEVLYQALEDGYVDLPIRDAWDQRSLRIRLAPFTLVAATTEEGLLPDALRSRFVYQERLQFYDRDILGEILTRDALTKGLPLAPDARDLIACASRDTPRKALALLQTVCDEARATGRSAVDGGVARAALARLGTAANGVSAAETGYLQILAEANGPVGLSTIAAKLSTSQRNVQLVFEPFLLRRGMVELTIRGRCLTPEGRESIAA